MKKQIFTFFLLLSPFIGWAQELSVSPFHEDDHEGGLFAGGSVIYWNNTETKATTLQFCPEVGWRFNETWATSSSCPPTGAIRGRRACPWQTFHIP